MADVSPPKWHLAHTTWFFETLLLKEFVAGYEVYHPQYETLFNSYYLSIGTPYPRERRGLLSRPTVAEIFQYRNHIDEQVVQLLENFSMAENGPLLQRMELGLNHEQQHQELLLTDIKYNFFSNPLQPVYDSSRAPLALGPSREVEQFRWIEFSHQLTHIGADVHGGFCFDNETPPHQVFLAAYALADRPVNCGEFLAFMQAGGYERPELWLADGWHKKVAEGWCAPLYWQQSAGRWQLYTLHGARSLDPAEPVCHLSYYEADAFARWADARLPSEAEWESAAAGRAVDGHFVRAGIFHPQPPPFHPQSSHGHRTDLRQLFGDVWEWTASAYAPYPGFTPPPGAVGEYNGKFMCNQMVLRGGSSDCVRRARSSAPPVTEIFLSVGPMAVQRCAAGEID